MKTVAIAAALLTCAAACSSSHQGALHGTTTSVGASSTPRSSTATSGASGSAPSTTITASSTHSPGDRLAAGQGRSVTFFAYQAPATVNDREAKPAPAGKMYATAEVQSCAGPTPGTSAGPADFLLQLADGRQIGPRLTVRDPGFYTSVLKPNGCTRGFITFQIDAGARAALLIYVPTADAWRVA